MGSKTTKLAAAIGIAAAAGALTHLLASSQDDPTKWANRQVLAEIDALRTEMALINARLDEVVRRQQEIEVHASRQDSQSRSEGVKEQKDAPSTAGLSRLSGTTVQSRDLMTSALENDLDSLRELVKGVIEEEREARSSQMRETQWERLSAFKRYREGPYGEHNVRVNRIAEQLSLNASQQALYHELLVDYEQQVGALYEGLDFTAAWRGEADAAELQWRLDGIQASKEALDVAFDEEFTQTLTAEQAARYEALPVEERGIGTDAGSSALALQGDSLDSVPSSVFGEIFRNAR